jgi:uncharacterized protein involved in exopolysaccharide biosynthesis
MKKFNDNELRIAQLQRKLDVENTHYRKYAESLEQGKIDRSLQAERISNVNVVQTATFDIKPVRPSKLINGVIGLFLAISGSIGVALLAESRGRRKALPEAAAHRNGVASSPGEAPLLVNHASAS